MDFGTQQRRIEDLTRILEEGLGIAMTKDDDSESGVSFYWSDDPDELGFSYYGILVRPTRASDDEDRRIRLRRKHWAKYSFVITISEELEVHIARIRELIARGILEAEEIPLPRF